VLAKSREERAMKRLLMPGLIVLALCARPVAQTPAGDEAGVRAALNAYIQGHATGDPAHFTRAFHPDGMLFWVGPDGQLMRRTAAEYIRGASGKPAADEAQRRRRIVSVHVTGTAANGVVVLDYPTVKFTDYMNLVKVGSEWKIINKTYVAERKTPLPAPEPPEAPPRTLAARAPDFR
jgi:hypothetical protein